MGGRQPLCGMGVTSLISVTSNPEAESDRIAASRPEPGPFTHTSTFLIPASMASRAALEAACWAAKGVDFLEPLKPERPALDQETVLPWESVILIRVLLKVA